MKKKREKVFSNHAAIIREIYMENDARRVTFSTDFEDLTSPREDPPVTERIFDRRGSNDALKTTAPHPV